MVILTPDAQQAFRALDEGSTAWTLHAQCEYASDIGQWGASLINHDEVLIPILNAAGVRSVAEIGAYAGDLTRFLSGWARDARATILTVDPVPQPELIALAEERDNVTLVAKASLDALATIELADAIIIDGDHNYHTVSEELRIIGERSRDEALPLLLFHDVAWPHGRRDDYYAPEQIPDDARHPIHEGGGIFPGDHGIHEGGLPYRWPAAQEGGARNGVLTAIEDFVDQREGLQLAVAPAFFGLGVVWHRDALYAPGLADVIAHWDRNALVARLEANRVFHLATVHRQMIELADARKQVERRGVVLERFLSSSAFSIAERLSRLRDRVGIGRGHSIVSKDEIRRALDYRS
jgi:hypothetical protein